MLDPGALELGAAAQRSSRYGTCEACGYEGARHVERRAGKLLSYCHACGATGRRGSTREVPAAAEKPDRAGAILRRWRAAREAEGTIVERYLENRALRLPPRPVLRFLRWEKHTDTGTTWPCMLARAERGSEMVAVHRTYLAPDGSGKAPVSPAKMTLGPVRGGAVRLFPPAERLAIAEGIETALAFAALSGVPTWATLAAGNLASVELPDIVAEVIIAADHDKPGLAAAERAAMAHHRAGRRVRIIKPEQPGDDFNDEWMRHERASATH